MMEKTERISAKSEGTWQKFHTWLTAKLPRDYQPSSRVITLVTNLVLLLNIVICVVILGVTIGTWDRDRRGPLLLVVALGAFQVGGLVGFAYSTFGEETTRFSSFSTFLNGLLGGAALTDLAKRNDSLILRGLRSLALAAGLTQGGAAFVAMVIVAFAIAGFFFMYLNKKFFLNLATARSDAGVNELLKARGVVYQGVNLNLSEPGHLPPVTAEVRQAAARLTSSPEVGQGETLESLVADAKALYISTKFDQAGEVLEKALGLFPGNAEVLNLLANVLIDGGKPLEAVPYLRTLTRLPGASIETWKLLGYACLFDPQLLNEAKMASSKYLALVPNDVGAKVNLACAYGQQGPNPETREKLKPLLQEIVKSSEDRELIRRLTRGDLDFSKWVGDEMFETIVGSEHSPADET